MKSSGLPHRRRVLQIGATLTGVGIGSDLLTTTPAVADSTTTRLSKLLLAQDFTVAIRIPEPDLYIHDPGMQVLENRHLFVVAPVRRRPVSGKPGARAVPQATSLLLARSTNGGASWEQLPSLPKYRDATPFVHNNALYLLIPDYVNDQILLMRSDDEGKSWTPPSAIVRDKLWNCQTSMAQYEGRLYWALTNYTVGNNLKAISADLNKDLLDPGSWNVSDGCELPKVPDLLKDNLRVENKQNWHRPWSADTWLEPNVVNVNGRLRVLSRVVTDDFATAGLGAVCEIKLQGTEMNMKFSQFHPMPGGQCKFMIVYDEKTRLFWMLSNTPTDSHDLFERGRKMAASGFVAGPGNERRILTLHYGLDAMNWFPAGVVAMWPNPLQAFMYPSAVIDRDDLVFISRTSQSAPNQHDADTVTFHRIKNFRSLAVSLDGKLRE